MGKLSTHVLDTMHGVPAQGVRIDLYLVQDGQRQLLGHAVTNHDGRCDQPLLQGADFTRGVYELVFHAGDYFAARGVQAAEPRFVDEVALRFGVADPGQNYHVPLLVTPWTWSTYRGS
ncbi:hydroxyisourate hydrolase [Candidimonas nitroreducens]|uniref:5-hydroxyisourate hydrolase n=1 Tax=Candidimonas nitroreducens TaxID=683354 RepID=A0A225MRB9_9BURK|nr:hydroxyisourate hydrolase [Candidimonas nitroreducens]OWT63738.1 hydroxyisourate hydrolase [Candidimonas nitroreducens]